MDLNLLPILDIDRQGNNIVNDSFLEDIDAL